MTKNADTPVVLVTGASRGIGLAIVQAFAGAGWRTAGCARTPGPALSAAADLVQGCDVSDGAAVHALVEAVLGRFGRLDALVCNAGLAGSNPVGSEDDDARWRAILATNLDGTWHACRAALPRLPDGHGRIVNIASVLALRGVADQPAYCAAKHGVLGLTRSLALQAAARGITVNAICPGWTRTAMAEAR
ncbi:MAG TPA: SDR family oxidoreductase, partial [Plasticicumulans sp.]|nr:SDR family oxidoreductase [Plasticicumulans sp.]